MFSKEDIAEVMAAEIGETREGQSRTMVTPLENGGAAVSGTVYFRRNFSQQNTTYRDINIFEQCASPRYKCSEGWLL